MNNQIVNYNEESYIFFSIGTFNYAFNAKYVLDIMQLVELEYPESMPDFITGLLEYNNQIIKIIDIRNILKLNATPYSLNSKIIIVKTNNDIFGIIIDDVKEIRRINTLSLNVPPYDTEKSYLEAIYTDREFSVTILNLENIEKKINSSYSFLRDSKNSASMFLAKDTTSKETSIIVVEYEDYEIGIIADAIGETIDIAENLVNYKQDMAINCLNECVINNSIYLFLDIKKLFGDEKLYVSWFN